MMRKNNNNRNNNMKHRGGSGGGGQRRYQSGGGGGGNHRGGNDSGNITRQKQHATSQREKYSNMARDAQINGDRVDVEYYLQHVDHYTRVLNDIAAIEAERFAHQREQQIVPGGPNDPNAQQFHEQQAQQSNATSEGDSANATGQSNHEAPTDLTANQPRMTRQPRRQYNAPAAEDNGAREANSNSTDIPLPGNILPPI